MCRNLSVVSSSHLWVPPSLRRNCQPVIGITVSSVDSLLIQAMVLATLEPTIQRPVPETIVAQLFLRIRHCTCTENPILRVSLPVDRPSLNNILQVIFPEPSTPDLSSSSLRWNLNCIRKSTNLQLQLLYFLLHFQHLDSHVVHLLLHGGQCWRGRWCWSCGICWGV